MFNAMFELLQKTVPDTCAKRLRFSSVADMTEHAPERPLSHLHNICSRLSAAQKPGISI
jgi:hypothetical protein